MKTNINTQAEEKKFTPFSVTFIAETIEDARLLYHIANHAGIRDVIMNDPRYNGGGQGYSRDVTKYINTLISEGIRNKIESMGYRV